MMINRLYILFISLLVVSTHAEDCDFECPSGYERKPGRRCYDSMNDCKMTKESKEVLGLDLKWRFDLGECNSECPVGYELKRNRKCYETPNDCQVKKKARSGGDPHFQLWHQAVYDFHGACDLVLVHAERFASGLGLDIHVRTTIQDHWSYIEEVAVKIGNDILQVAGDGVVYYNHELVAEDLEKSLPADIAGVPLNFSKDEFEAHFYTLSQGSSVIVIKTWNEMAWVSILGAEEEDFEKAVGLLGEFENSRMLARDGETEFLIEDADMFGLEWQVNTVDGGDPKLFNTDRFPEFPQLCEMPDPENEGRRLEIPGLKEAAVEACAKWGDAEMEMCVFDVLATGRLELAEIGFM